MFQDAHHVSNLFALAEDKNHMMDSTLVSTWSYVPYFVLYFMSYILNTLIWPIMLVEHNCLVKFYNNTQMTNSCIADYFQSSSPKFQENIELIDGDIINLLIVATVISSVISLCCYFLVWKPILQYCPTLANLLPPIALCLQSFLQMYAEKYILYPVFTYLIITSVCIPSLHGNFQGVLTLYYQIKSKFDNIPCRKTKKFVSTRLEISHGFPFFAMIFTGALIGACFEMSFSLIFLLTAMFSGVNCMYGVLMLPIKCKCDLKEEDIDDGEDSDFSDSDSLSSEEARILTNMAKFKQDNGLLSNQSNLLTEAPMIFSESSYRKELVIIIELTVFTIAIIGDAVISGPYLMQQPFEFNLQEYGYCVSLQGLSKLVGLLFVKCCLYFKSIKHGTLIVIAAANYVIYYVMLGLASTKTLIYITMTCNIFGGLALPALSSFITVSFTETRNSVVQLATVSSLIATIAYSSIEYYIYVKTKELFPGAVFFITASLIIIGFVIVIATYFSTVERNRRKTKDFTDTLLNDYE